MSLSIAIVGLPNVGKSTLFNALTKKSVDASNYPFCTIDPCLGTVSVPDDRLWKLSKFSKSAKTIPAAVEFVDIAGLVKGASEGEGLGNQFLSHIRETDAIAHVVRIFEDPDITHVHGDIDPLSDISVINLELIMADLQGVTKRLSGVEKEVRSGDKEAIIEKEALEKLAKVLSGGKRAEEVVLDEKEEASVKSLGLLSRKPIIYVLNKISGGVNLDETKGEKFEKLMEFFKENNSLWVTVDVGFESEIKDMGEDEKTTFREEMNYTDSGVNDLIKKGYEILGLISFFTTGEDETRGWTIVDGSSAPEAGAAIHSDFRDKFIRAEVIEWDKLLEVGSYASAREKGLLRLEGKGYIVKDGDVIEFRI